MPQQSAEAALDHVAAKKGLKRVPRVQSITKRRSAATIWTVSQLLEGFGDPRAILLEIAATPTDKLAEQAACSLLDALQERRLCAMAVLPYVAQKLPVQVDMRHTRAIHLNLVTDDQYQELLTIADTPTPDDANHVQLIQGQVIDDTDQPPTTAAGDTAHDAHVLAEQSDDTANGTSPANAPHTAEAAGGEQRGFGLREKQPDATAMKQAYAMKNAQGSVSFPPRRSITARAGDEE